MPDRRAKWSEREGQGRVLVNVLEWIDEAERLRVTADLAEMADDAAMRDRCLTKAAELYKSAGQHGMSRWVRVRLLGGAGVDRAVAAKMAAYEAWRAEHPAE